VSKYINYKLIFTVIAIPIVLVVLFPSPYFDVRIDYEPDYFANILSVLLNNHPVEYTHPGLTLTYLSAFFVRIVGFFESQESFILSLRFFFIFLNLTIISLSMSILNRNSTEHVLLFFAILFLYPSGFFYFDQLSPGVILSSLGVLIAILGTKLNESKAIYPLSFGFVLALGVATKIPFIIVIIPAIFSMFVGFIKAEKGYFKVSFFLVLGSFICSSIILFYPILPIIPLWPLNWPNIMIIIWSIIDFFQVPYKAFFYIISSAIILFFILRKVRIFLNNSQYEYKYESLYRTLSLICVSVVFIVTIVDIVKGKSYIEIVHFSGHFLPTLGFLVLFFTDKLLIFKSSMAKYYIPFILLLALSFKSYTNFINYQDSIIEDNKFSENTQSLLEDSNDVVFYPSSEFTSKEYFFLWSDHRYGDSKALFSDSRESIPFSIDSKLERIHILNEKNFFIPEGYFEDKETVIYMNYLHESSYTGNLHKSLLNQWLYRHYRKDECTEPYKGFSKGKNFIVIFPKNLEFSTKNSLYELNNKETSERFMQANAELGYNPSKDFNPSEIYISNKLMNAWVDKCNYKVNYSVGYFAGIKSIFLKVTT
jgi:hypothetical protein